MPRPRKHRRISRRLRPAIYKPAGVPLEALRKVILLPEELEALRLADLESLSQAEAAVRMEVSRSTFQRILARARRQVTLALVEGQALSLQGSAIESGPPGTRRRDQASR